MRSASSARPGPGATTAPRSPTGGPVRRALLTLLLARAGEVVPVPADRLSTTSTARTLPYVPWKGRIAASVRRTANAIVLADYGNALAAVVGPGAR
ncbi:hypothetical protein ABZV93_23000 [Actinopolymorpha sp. NPDC004070]|uniref:hypothetical protein n=1 Tax=Actinopolymorpha sp. NPDC004070 TaxID=3154548 RepID=UPI0033B20F25